MRKLSWVLLTLFAIGFAGDIAMAGQGHQGNQQNQNPGAQGDQQNQDGQYQDGAITVTCASSATL